MATSPCAALGKPCQSILFAILQWTLLSQSAAWTLPQVVCYLLHLLLASHGPFCIWWSVAQNQSTDSAHAPALVCTGWIFVCLPEDREFAPDLLRPRVINAHPALFARHSFGSRVLFSSSDQSNLFNNIATSRLIPALFVFAEELGEQKVEVSHARYRQHASARDLRLL